MLVFKAKQPILLNHSLMKAPTTQKPKPAVTTEDIARRTGLSKMTVSRVLNNHPYVSVETRKKVMDAVKDLGFRPNTLAKRFFTGKTRLVGLIIPIEYMFSSFYFKELFQGVLECAEEKEYDILLHNSTSPRKTPIEKCLDLVQGKLVEGLLVAAPMTYDDYPLRLTHESIALVVLGETSCGDKVNRVIIPNRAGAADAVGRLIKAGHRRIAIATFGPDHVESKERFLGYRDALQSGGIAYDESLVVPAEYNRRDAFKGVRELMKTHPDVTAIFACNADMALGAADALFSLNLSMPTDVSVVAFDDCDEMEDHEPPIAAVRQFPYKLGYAACEMLLKTLATDSRPKKPQSKIIETEFMERLSMGPARK